MDSEKTAKFIDKEFDVYQRYSAATEWDNNGIYMGRHYEDRNTITTINVNDTKVMAMLDTGAVANERRIDATLGQRWRLTKSQTSETTTPTSCNSLSRHGTERARKASSFQGI